MSYDISLKDKAAGKILELDWPHFMHGGTYAVDGTKECYLNVTYNYAPYFQEAFGESGMCAICGKSGDEAAPLLLNAIECLLKLAKTERSNDKYDIRCENDYWFACAANAVIPLRQLLILAELKPEGIFCVE